MENKFNSYLALTIGVLVYIIGFAFLVLKSLDTRDYTAAIMYMFSTSSLSFAIFTKIENKKILRITAISQMIISCLFIILLGLSDMDGAIFVLLISITALYLAFYFYIKKITKEETEGLLDATTNEDDTNEDDDENPYWMEGAEDLDDNIKDKKY